MESITGTIRAVCVSELRGTQKKNVRIGRLVVGWGLEGDAHGGDWHRQVSLLSLDRIRAFNEKGAEVRDGDFGENLVVEGIDFRSLPVGTRLTCGDAELELTQIGKECHSHCQIYRKMGDCIMPREGVFARVLRDGAVSVGDVMEARLPEERPLQAAVITLSDKGHQGQREDKSGPLARETLEAAGYQVAAELLLPDNQTMLEEELRNLADRRQMDLILTTGGTGFSRRDVTPEATLAVAERQAPGIAEAMRAFSMEITGRAMLSRAVAAIRGGSLIVNLPGSPKAVEETLGHILPHLEHGIRILRGDASECAATAADEEEAEDDLEDASLDPENRTGWRLKVQIARETPFMGPGCRQLLTEIEETGSVRLASQNMGMSYSKAWRILNRLEEELGYPALLRKPGGKQGGETRLTAPGKEMLERFLRFEEECKAAVQEIFQRHYGGRS